MPLLGRAVAFEAGRPGGVGVALPRPLPLLLPVVHHRAVYEGREEAQAAGVGVVSYLDGSWPSFLCRKAEEDGAVPDCLFLGLHEEDPDDDHDAEEDGRLLLGVAYDARQEDAEGNAAVDDVGDEVVDGPKLLAREEDDLGEVDGDGDGAEEEYAVDVARAISGIRVRGVGARLA